MERVSADECGSVQKTKLDTGSKKCRVRGLSIDKGVWVAGKSSESEKAKTFRVARFCVQKLSDKARKSQQICVKLDNFMCF